MAKKARAALVAGSIAVLSLATAASAGTIRVPGDFDTLKQALLAAHDGDEIVVADGVYRGRDNRNLDFGGKRITLRSENGPASCVIDCERRNRAFRFHRGETADAVLEGFTIQNGQIEDDNGGAILCENSSPTLRNCVFRWNSVQGPHSRYKGGGALANLDGAETQVIDCVFEENAVEGNPQWTAGGALANGWGARPTYVRCTFGRNRASSAGVDVTAFDAYVRYEDCEFIENVAEAYHGGGVACVDGGAVRLANCRFVGNSAAEDGGGVWCARDSYVRLEDCQFHGNSAPFTGGAVAIGDYCYAVVRRCVFTGNAAAFGGGGGGGGMGVGWESYAVVRDSFFSGNSGHGDGGAMAVWEDSDLRIENSTIVGNEATPLGGWELGGAVCAWESRLTVVNSVVHGNIGDHGSAFALVTDWDGGPPRPMVLTVSGSLVQDGQCGVYIEFEEPCETNPYFIVNWSADNFEADPRLVRNPSPGADGTWGTADDDYGNLRLRPGSPCIDAGDPAYVPQPGETDINGDPRVLDGDGDGVAIIDIGADEFARPPYRFR